jgi:3-dehydroquinate dehydratase/shikimate dehydrogenase
MTHHTEAKICVPVCVTQVCELESAVNLASAVGDLIELRFDCLAAGDLAAALTQTRALITRFSKPLIVTFRPAEQGGRRSLDSEIRMSFCLFDKPAGAAFYDIELDLALGLLAQKPPPAGIDWSAVICSHHDFAGVPDDLEQIYDRLASTPARVLKIAVQADDITDCLQIFRLLDRACHDGRELIAIAMGAAGVLTRILGPSRGAFLTYGALASERGTAPGQPTASDLRDVYRIHELDADTRIMALMGSPVAHSVSPHMHNAAFKALNINAVYLPLEVRDLPAFIRRLVHSQTRELDWNLRGLSITAPHKSSVFEVLDWVEPAATEIGAVNTIVVQDGALHGYNTDAPAVLEPVKQKLGSLRDARCAILGAGGVASAVLWSLRNEGAQATLFARDARKGQALAAKFDSRYQRLEDLPGNSFDVVINATPLGTRGALEAGTAATAEQLRGARLAYDLVYNPVETRFMREARSAGCEAIGGLPMLVLQAAEQFELWTGCKPSLDVMSQAASDALLKQDP